MTALTQVENDALVIVARDGLSYATVLAAVRAAVAATERRMEQSEDHRAAVLRGDLAAVRDIAYRADAAGAADALHTIHARACRALNEETR